MKFLIREVEHKKFWQYELIDDDGDIMFKSPLFNEKQLCENTIADIKYAPVYDVRLDIEKIQIGRTKLKNT